MCETEGVTRMGAVFEGTDFYSDISIKDRTIVFVFSHKTTRRDKANQAHCILDTSHLSN